MIIHPNKSKYLCVNSNDTAPIILGNVIINPTDKYVYLGAPILNSEIEQQIELQLQQKHGYVQNV